MSNIENYVGELASQEEDHTIQSMLSDEYADPNAKRREILDKEICSYVVNNFTYSIYNTALKNIRMPRCENLPTWYNDNRDDINSWFSNIRENSNGQSIEIDQCRIPMTFHLPDSHTSVEHIINIALYYIPSCVEEDEKSNRVRLEICENLFHANGYKQTKYPFVKFSVDFYDDARMHTLDPVIVCGQLEDGKEFELPCDASVTKVALNYGKLGERGGLDIIRGVLMELFANTKKDDSRKGY